jgi:hypothetical protein
MDGGAAVDPAWLSSAITWRTIVAMSAGAGGLVVGLD